MGFTHTQDNLWAKDKAYQEYLEEVLKRIKDHPGTMAVYSAATGKRVVGVKDGENIKQDSPHRYVVMKRLSQW